MLRYQLIGSTQLIDVAYDLTHGARVVVDFFTDATGRVRGGQLVSTEAEVNAAWRAWRNA